MCEAAARFQLWNPFAGIREGRLTDLNPVLEERLRPGQEHGNGGASEHVTGGPCADNREGLRARTRHGEDQAV